MRNDALSIVQNKKNDKKTFLFKPFFHIIKLTFHFQFLMKSLRIKETKSKIIWLLFGINILLALLSIISIVLEKNWANHLQLFTLYFTAFVFFLHLCWSLTFLKGIFFFFLSFFVSFIAEILGITYGTLFGSHYIYAGQTFDIMLLNIPVLVPIYWTIFIYTSYAITNSFLFWLNKKIPCKRHKDIIRLPSLIIIDGILVVIIDLLMDPIAVKFGYWIWLQQGFYFGIPLGNFLGWFLTAVAVVSIFRIFEYYMPWRNNALDASTNLVPIFGYGMLFVFFSILAFHFHIYALIFIGFFLIVPIIAANLFLAASKKLPKIRPRRPRRTNTLR